jgi:hypothetical protein
MSEQATLEFTAKATGEVIVKLISVQGGRGYIQLGHTFERLAKHGGILSLGVQLQYEEMRALRDWLDRRLQPRFADWDLDDSAADIDSADDT